MRATEIIRGVLDLIDQIDCNQEEQSPVQGEFAALFAQLSAEKVGYDNSPAPQIQGVDSVTTNAGGGLNGPKNPADLRTDSVSLYPNFQAKE